MCDPVTVVTALTSVAGVAQQRSAEKKAEKRAAQARQQAEAKAAAEEKARREAEVKANEERLAERQAQAEADLKERQKLANLNGPGAVEEEGLLKAKRKLLGQ